MKKLVLIFTLFVFALQAQSTKTVTGAYDGDGLRFKGENRQSRLLGVDAPELHSPFVTATQSMGVESGQFLRNWLKGKEVFVIEHPKTDMYNRKLITCIYSGVDVSETILANGMAHYYYSPKLKKEQRDRYKQAEQLARFERLGIWGQKDEKGNYVIPTMPSVWRRKHRGK